MLVIFVVGMAYVWNVLRGCLGCAMQVVCECEIVVVVMGVDFVCTKISAFVILLFLVGVSGALYAFYLFFVMFD